MSHLDPVGYTYDAAAYHPSCLPIGVDPDSEEVGAVFAWEDAAFELVCDVCFEPLLESESNPQQEDGDV
jgi:hypothetical protein